MNWPLLIGFKLSWFALVLFQDQLLVPVLLFIAWFLWRSSPAERWCWLMLALVGVSLDSLLLGATVISFKGMVWLPWWMVTLWLVFSLAVVKVFSVYLQNYMVAAVLAAIAGPLAYKAGAALSGQMQMNASIEAVALMMLCWAGLGVLFGWSRRFYA